jgi:hypothetical protein
MLFIKAISGEMNRIPLEVVYETSGFGWFCVFKFFPSGLDVGRNRLRFQLQPHFLEPLSQFDPRLFHRPGHVVDRHIQFFACLCGLQFYQWKPMVRELE